MLKIIVNVNSFPIHIPSTLPSDEADNDEDSDEVNGNGDKVKHAKKICP